MSTIDVLWLAHLNRNTEDAGSDSTINLTINVDGEDVLDNDYGFNVGDGEAYLNGGSQLETPFDSAGLTSSSVRIGVRGDDAWAPGDVFLFGQSTAEFNSGVAVPLVMETGLTDFLSTDPSEGPLTIPLRRVDPGNSSTIIRRVLLLVDTQFGWDSGTDSAIQLEVFAGENLVLREEINDTSQPDLESFTSNWYVMDTLVPFTRGEVQAGGRIVLSFRPGHRQRATQPGGVSGLATSLGAPVDEHGHKRGRSLGRPDGDTRVAYEVLLRSRTRMASRGVRNGNKYTGQTSRARGETVA
jgi:hypothetical protein